MSVETSYFKKEFNNPNAVSIAAKCPLFFKGREYKKLAPKYWFLKKYKQDGDKEFYIKKYFEEVLNKLDPKKVYNELGENSILLCWESSEKFCHRHIVAEWLSKTIGVEIKEIDFEYNSEKIDDNFEWKSNEDTRV